MPQSDFAPLWRRLRFACVAFLDRYASHVNAAPGFREDLVRVLDQDAGAGSVAAGPRTAFEGAHLAMHQAADRSLRFRRSRTGVIGFRRAGDADRHKMGGWTAAEPWGSWTEGPHVQILFAVKPPRGRWLRIELEIGNVNVGPPNPRLSVEVRANGWPAALWEFAAPGATHRSMDLSPELVGDRGLVLLALLIETPVSPLSLGFNQDPRLLGLCVSRLTFCLVALV